jgi:predicted ATPase
VLSSIKLRNFKAFSDQTFPLAPLSLFMGENGAGKSSVIQSLLLLRQSMDSGDLVGRSLNLNGHLCSIGAGVDLLRQGADEEEITVELTNSEGLVSTYDFGYDPAADRLPMLSRNVVLPEMSHETFTYLTAERMGPRLTNPRLMAKAAKRDMGIHGEGALAVLEEFRAHILDANDPRRRGLSGSLEELFQSYLRDISPNARVELKSYNQVDSIGSSFSFTAAGGLPGLPFRPTNVGFGLSYCLPILVACLVATPGSMLVIENPEAHLHTKSQRAVCDLLVRTAQAGTQVLIETHSREFFHWLRNRASDGSIPSNIGCMNYLEASDVGGQRVSRCSSLTSLDESLLGWPQNFFDAYGSPTDLIAPVTY